jgi:hypothetical protein
MKLLTGLVIGALMAFVVGAAMAARFETGPSTDIAPIDIDTSDDAVILPKTEDETEPSPDDDEDPTPSPESPETATLDDAGVDGRDGSARDRGAPDGGDTGGDT